MRLAIVIVLWGLALQASVLATSALGASIAVTTTADELAVSTPNGNCSLREAIQAAHDNTTWDACAAGSGADTITVPAGTYNLSAANGAVIVQDSQVTIDGAGQGSNPAVDTIVDAGGTHPAFWTIGSSPIQIQQLRMRNGGAVDLQNSSGPLTLDQITATGTTLGGNGAISGGGTTLAISNSTIDANAGKGIFESAASTTISDSTITNNGQGGIETHHGTITGSTISGNGGKGIYSLGPLNLSNSTVSGSTGSSGDFGVGIDILIQSGTASSTLDHVIVTGNTAPSDGGDAGVLNEATAGASSDLTITDSTISANQAPGGGGFVNTPGGGSATIGGSTISGNTATTGQAGGISNDGALTLVNSTVSGNNSAGSGAGIATGGPLTLRSSTIAGNTSTNGTGGIIGVGSVDIGNSIVADNAGHPGSGNDCFASLTSAGYNLVESFDPGQCPITGDLTGNITGTDPMLGALGNNGGPTFTQALLTGSPAIDTGKAFASAVDQRGLLRPIDFTGLTNAPGGDGSDIGAFEVQPDPPDQPPALLLIGNRSIAATQTLSFQVAATDPDGNPLTYSASNLPPGASFDPGTHQLSWTPTVTQVGSYPNVRFEVSDGVLSDVENITITVSDAPVVPSSPSPGSSPSSSAPSNDAQLDAAIKKCKKKHRGKAQAKQRQKCIKNAKRRFGAS